MARRRRADDAGTLTRVLVTCEHGGNLVPASFAALFRGRGRALQSHRGWDPGALELAGAIAARLPAPMCFALTTRLLVDLNRSESNPSLMAPWLAELPVADRRAIIRDHHRPYRRHVETTIARLLRARSARVLHVSVHTFTPVLRGQRRDVDIGVLFDPARRFESAAAAEWMDRLRKALPRLRIRANQPYLGTDDGLTTHLRTRHADARYAGIELEVNQRFARRGGTAWQRLIGAIAETLADAVAALDVPHA